VRQLLAPEQSAQPLPTSDGEVAPGLAQHGAPIRIGAQAVSQFGVLGRQLPA